MVVTLGGRAGRIPEVLPLPAPWGRWNDGPGPKQDWAG